MVLPQQKREGHNGPPLPRATEKRFTMHARYQSGFTKPLVNQLLAILERDQQAALDLVNASRPLRRALPPFQAFYKEAAPIQNWPALVLIAPETTFNLDSDPDLRTESVRFVCALAIIGSDPEWLADDAMDYLRTVDIVLSSAPLSDFYAPLTVSHRTLPSGETSGLDATVSKILDLRITRHDLGTLVARRGGALARGPQIEFLIELEER
jgi:hypothetical protein